MTRNIHIISMLAGMLLVPQLGFSQTDTLDLGRGVVRNMETVSEAVTTISGESLMDVPSSRFHEMIAGRILGLGALETSAEPDDEEMTFYVRGISTASSKTPIFVIDGIIMEDYNYTHITAQEIETVSLLKDAAATAIYGAKGANGVILITTKRGRPDGFDVQITADMAGQFMGLEPTQLTGDEYTALRRQAWQNDGCPGDMPATMGADNNWYRKYMREAATMQRIGVSVSGGTKRVRAFTNINMVNQTGLVNQDETEKYNSTPRTFRLNFRSSVDIDITNWVSADVHIAGDISMRRFAASGSSNNDIYLNTFYLPSSIEGPLTENGYVATLANVEDPVYGILNRSGYTRLAGSYISTSAGLHFKLDRITKGLSINGRIAFQSSTDRFTYSQKTYRKEYYDFSLGQYVQQGSDLDTNLTNGVKGTFQYNINYIASLDYVRNFGAHGVQAHFYSYYSQRQTDETSADYPAVGMPYYWHNMGINAGYSYGGRYSIGANLGFYASDELSSKHKFAITPTVSAAWVISNEGFMAGAKNAVNLLKLRASYGVTPLDSFGVEDYRYLYMDFIKINGEIFLRGNENLEAELRKEANLGIDLGLFNQFSLSVDLFSRRTDNMLIPSSRVTPSYSGVSSSAMYVNEGRIKNGGIEIGADWNRKFGDWSVRVGAKWARNKNVVVYGGESPYSDSYAYKYHITGYPVGQKWGYLTDGFINTEEELNAIKGTYEIGTPRLGDFKYRDLNGDNRINEKDLAPIGNGTCPSDFTTITAGFGWRGLQLDVMFYGVNGYYGAVGYDTDMTKNGIYNDLHLASWTPERYASGAEIKAPALSYSSSSTSSLDNDYNITDRSFWRLKNVTLSYSLPEKVLSGKISGVRFVLSGNNLLTFSKLDSKVIDPEIGKMTALPLFRVVNFGVKLDF